MTEGRTSHVRDYQLDKYVCRECIADPHAMSNFGQAEPVARVQPLESLRTDGTPYTRPVGVQTELARILALPHSERAAEARHFHSETLVYLIRRRSRFADEELYEVVFTELIKRITRTARRLVRGFPKIAVEEILSKVEMQILELLVANSMDPAGDFFEVGFTQGVEGRTRNARRSYQRSTMGGRRGWLIIGETDEDGDEIERPIELVEDNGPSPEDIVFAMKDEEFRRDLFERARVRIKDPRYIEAAMLFFCENWQIRSKDPNKGSLERHFGATDSQIRYWISVVVKTMRELLPIQDATRAGAKP
jgi:hypothetical protein